MTKIFFAGAESHYKKLLDMGVKNIMFSFWSIREKGEENFWEVLREVKKQGCTIMIDSGAHSFFTSTGINIRTFGKRKTKIDVSIDQYVKEYIDWLKKAVGMKLIDYYVELDVDKIVGIEKVKAWREEMKANGLNPLLVWHDSMTRTEWEEMCKNNKYVCLADVFNTPHKVPVMIDIAKKYKTKVHGFALTQLDLLTKVPLYSVDSTTWLSGSRYGLTFVFRSNKLESYGSEEKDVRKKLKEKAEQKGLDFNKILRDDGEEVDKFNISQWLDFQDYLDKLWSGKEYWSEDMVAVAKEIKTEKFKRDEKGRFVEGNYAAFKKGLWARKHKIIDCDSCYIKDRCEFYQEGMLCAHRKFLIKKYKTRDIKEVMNRMWDELEDIDRRLELAKWFEVKDGGILDKSIDRLLGTKVFLLRYLGEIYQIPQLVEAMKEAEPKQILLQKITTIYNIIMEKKKKEKEVKEGVNEAET